MKMTTINQYRANAYTDHFIFGFCHKGEVRFAYGTGDLLESLTTLESGKVRFSYNFGHRHLLASLGSELLCTKVEFEEASKALKNKGDLFEKLITEHFGQTWKKNNVPYTEAGDIEIDGIAYQVKYERAELKALQAPNA